MAFLVAEAVQPPTSALLALRDRLLSGAPAFAFHAFGFHFLGPLEERRLKLNPDQPTLADAQLRWASEVLRDLKRFA